MTPKCSHKRWCESRWILLPRQINQVVDVTLTRDPNYVELRPASFNWRRSRFHVATVLDRWEETGRWWEQDTPLTVWRVLGRDGGTYELATANGTEWRLMTIHD